MSLCEYGCGQEAKHQFKNGRWCCSEYSSQCQYIKPKLSSNIPWNKGLRGKIIPWNKGKTGLQKMSVEARIKMSKKIPWNKGKTGLQKMSVEARIKMSNSHKGKTSITCIGREKLRLKMLNGGAIKAIKGIKKLSKAEIKLRDITKLLYPNCEFQYQIFNYALDIAILEYKIAIEYDGYYHFYTQDAISRDLKRQKEIEGQGWKFIRYSYIEKFPSFEKIKKDIERIIKNEQ